MYKTYARPSSRKDQVSYPGIKKKETRTFLMTPGAPEQLDVLCVAGL
jgi:hypothetical protein